MRHEFTTAEIAEFIKIWAEEFDEIITEDRARLEAGLVMELYLVLIQPLPGEPGYEDYKREEML